MLQWSEEYSIGNVRIDLQHEAFFGLMNEFEANRLAGCDKDKLYRTLKEMYLFVAFHFYSEENLMVDIGYPDIKAHKMQHQVLLELLNKKVIGFDVGEYHAKDIEDFLLNWFIKHAMQEDVKIGKYLIDEY